LPTSPRKTPGKEGGGRRRRAHSQKASVTRERRKELSDGRKRNALEVKRNLSHADQRFI
jgi:hypothetical protein